MLISVLILIPFFILLGVLLYAEHETVHNIKLRYMCMISLVPLIVLYYLLSVPLDRINWLVLIGLIFGYGGDIFLMFDKEEYFIFGLGSFLVGHIFYILGFLFSIVDFMLFPLWGILLIIPSVLIVGVVLIKTLDKMGDLKVPTLVYVGVIFTMGFCTILRLASFDGLGFFFVWLGAQSFMASDGMIAIKKFHGNFKLDEIWIKLTYVLAQFFIAQGIIISALS